MKPANVTDEADLSEPALTEALLTPENDNRPLKGTSA